MVVRGKKVILDSDLAELYGVETRRLNEQVRRNKNKFPEDFMFQLTHQEFSDLKSQISAAKGRNTFFRVSIVSPNRAFNDFSASLRMRFS